MDTAGWCLWVHIQINIHTADISFCGKYYCKYYRYYYLQSATFTSACLHFVFVSSHLPLCFLSTCPCLLLRLVSSGSALAASVCKKITGRLTSAIAKQEDVSVQLEALDIMADMLCRYSTCHWGMFPWPSTSTYIWVHSVLHDNKPTSVCLFMPVNAHKNKEINVSPQHCPRVPCASTRALVHKAVFTNTVCSSFFKQQWESKTWLKYIKNRLKMRQIV